MNYKLLDEFIKRYTEKLLDLYQDDPIVQGFIKFKGSIYLECILQNYDRMRKSDTNWLNVFNLESKDYSGGYFDNPLFFDLQTLLKEKTDTYGFIDFYCELYYRHQFFLLQRLKFDTDSELEGIKKELVCKRITGKKTINDKSNTNKFFNIQKCLEQYGDLKTLNLLDYGLIQACTQALSLRVVRGEIKKKEKASSETYIDLRKWHTFIHVYVFSDWQNKAPKIAEYRQEYNTLKPFKESSSIIGNFGDRNIYELSHSLIKLEYLYTILIQSYPFNNPKYQTWNNANEFKETSDILRETVNILVTDPQYKELLNYLLQSPIDTSKNTHNHI